MGQTKQTLKGRFTDHFYKINNPHKITQRDSAVGKHFSSPTHSGLDDIKIYVVHFITASTDSFRAAQSRNQAEKLWIHRLKTQIPLGLNTID